MVGMLMVGLLNNIQNYRGNNMLVTLATNQALSAGGSASFPYACQSVQKIFIKIDDSTGSTAYDHSVTVQLGNRTICNGASGFGLYGMAKLQGGTDGVSALMVYQIDFGSHQLLDNENLYVTVQAGAAALDAVDVSALVDSTSGAEFPVRYTEYSDTVFTSENVLTAINYNSGRNAVDEDAYNIEIRNNVNSSSPSLISASNWFHSAILDGGTGTAEDFGLLCKNGLPLTTTFNYSASAVTDRILVASQMGTSKRAISQGSRQRMIAKSQVGK
jgi:hypothetical protein